MRVTSIRYKYRFFKTYRDKKKGSSFWKMLLEDSTTLLLFHGEAEAASDQLHLSGNYTHVADSAIANKSLMLGIAN